VFVGKALVELYAYTPFALVLFAIACNGGLSNPELSPDGVPE
jgi:hypothetical protein